MGEAVACVIAETAAAAREAAELIEVDYEDLAAVTDPRAAIAKGAPAVWDEAKNNVVLDWEKGDKAASAAAFAAAAHRVSFDLVNNRVISNPMEPRAAIAEWEAGEERFVLTTSTQGSHGLKRVLADNVFKVPHNKVRVVTPDVGGAFGTKITVYPEHVMALYAARRLNRPVKWVADRIETFVSDLHGRDNLTHAEMALDKDGKVLALRVNTLANMGAHVAPFNPFITTDGGTSMLSGVYDIPSIRIEVKCVLTNTMPVDAYRGAGRPEAIYVVERLMDVAARKMGVDAAELRRRNAIPPSALPYKTQTGVVYDSGKYAGIMAQAMERAGWNGFAARKKDSAARGKIRGIGLANYIEVCGRGLDERAEIRFDPSGDVMLLLGTQTNGQGHETTYAQMLADEIGVPFERIRIVQGDTDLISHGRGTGGSRSLCVGGSAVLHAAERVREKGKKIAAHVLEAAEADVAFADGTYRIAGTDRSITMTEVAKAAFVARSVPHGVEMGLDEVAHYQPAAPTFPNGCHICEVEIDPDTGVVDVLSYTVVDDFGRVVNPMVVEGQVHGGIAQGLGQALLEDARFDPESAQLLSGSFMDYCMPRADDMPNIDFTYDESSPCVTNPVGAKGCGEAGSVGAPPALISAITDALADRGVTHVDMPVTRERMWRLLNGAA
jgi:aerobic carbon-monoxide dehydrogenase large subunit